MKKLINYFKKNYPRSLSFYYKIRFIYRAFYIKEPRAHLFWKLRRGDEKFHKNYDLTEESIFFDAGGFEGEFTEKILRMFNCKAYVFEPHPVYYKKLISKFHNNQNVIIYNYGLGGSTENIYLTDETASSKTTTEETKYKVLIKDITEVINEIGINKVDLLKLNIEGSEYDLLDKLISSGKIEFIDKLQIQFHDNVDEAELRREIIRNSLQKTHKEIWSYYFVWERWDKRKIN